MGKWFVTQGEVVNGPFTTVEVQSHFTNGKFDGECLIWGHERQNWEKFPEWQNSSITAAKMTDEAKANKTSNQWHYAIEGNSKGPFGRDELIAELKGIKDKEEIMIWTKGMKAWADLFEFDDLVEEIGLSRRSHPRVPLTGSVVIKEGDNTFIGALKSISQGGFGAAQINSSLTIGQSVMAEIRSDVLGDALVVKAVVQYMSDVGVTGFKFDAINMESRSRIIDYIRHNHGGSTKAS